MRARALGARASSASVCHRLYICERGATVMAFSQRQEGIYEQSGCEIQRVDSTGIQSVQGGLCATRTSIAAAKLLNVPAGSRNTALLEKGAIPMGLIDKLSGLVPERVSRHLKNNREMTDTSICPLCFESITAETVFTKFCPVCGKAQEIRGLAKMTVYETCKSGNCRAKNTLRERPFLVHHGCKRHNPLIFNLNEEGSAPNRVKGLDGDEDGSGGGR